MIDDRTSFVVCISNEGFPASLETRKIYRLLPDSDASGLDLIRVVDESGDSYLYPRTLFLPIDLSSELKAALLDPC